MKTKIDIDPLFEQNETEEGKYIWPFTIKVIIAAALLAIVILFIFFLTLNYKEQIDSAHGFVLKLFLVVPVLIFSSLGIYWFCYVVSKKWRQFLIDREADIKYKDQQ